MKSLTIPLSGLLVSQFYYNYKLKSFIPKNRITIPISPSLSIIKVFVFSNGIDYQVFYNDDSHLNFKRDETIMVLV